MESPKESRISPSVIDEVSRGFQFYAKFYLQPTVYLLGQEMRRYISKTDFRRSLEIIWRANLRLDKGGYI